MIHLECLRRPFGVLFNNPVHHERDHALGFQQSRGFISRAPSSSIVQQTMSQVGERAAAHTPHTDRLHLVLVSGSVVHSVNVSQCAI